ncbi:MAG: SRPBCC family protein [Rhodospirillaceae bacterium]|nr:SRPBCC family protein [Rhodospirillaceae bacterium]
MNATADTGSILDREIVLSRVFDAPRDLVFKAWTDAKHISKWFGPKGFVTTTFEMDARVGGQWRFEIKAPDGTVFPNLVRYLEIKEPELLVFDHGSGAGDDPDKFRVTITFDAQGDGKTIVTLRQMHPSKARRQLVIGFGAVELGYQTLDKLAQHLDVA